MKTLALAFLLLLAINSAGCGRNRRDASAAQPLTIEMWTTLPAETKYEAATLERLKEGTPALQDEHAWEAFVRTVLIPDRMKELPNGMPGK